MRYGGDEYYDGYGDEDGIDMDIPIFNWKSQELSKSIPYSVNAEIFCQNDDEFK